MRLYATMMAPNNSSIANMIGNAFLPPKPLRQVNPGIPVRIENPFELKEPYFVRTLVDTPDLLTLIPTPSPRFIRLWYLNPILA